MYIDRVPNRTSPPTVLIRESCRVDSQVRTRTLANITNLPAELVEGIRCLLRGGTVSFARLEGGFDIVRSTPHGHVHAVIGAGRDASRVWNKFVARYNHLSSKRLVGVQLRYIASDVQP